MTGTRHALLLGLQQDMTEGSAPRLQHCGQVFDELALITNAYVAEVVRGRQLIEVRVGHAPLRVSAAAVAIQQKNLDRKFVVIDELQLLLIDEHELAYNITQSDTNPHARKRARVRAYHARRNTRGVRGRRVRAGVRADGVCGAVQAKHGVYAYRSTCRFLWMA